MSPRVSLRLVLLAIFAAAPAAAQPTTAPSPGQGARLHRLADDAAPGARILRDDDGRVRRAWSLSIHVDGVDPASRARAFIARYGDELALADGAPLVVARVLDVRGADIVRLSRVAFGGPVLGSSVVVRLRGDVVDYVGLRGAGAPLAVASRHLDRDAAVAAALSPTERLLDARAAAFPLGDRLIPAWVVDVAGERLHERRRVIVDARDGAVLLAHPLAHHAMGRVYAHNPTTDEGMTTDVELTHLTSRDYLTGRHFRVLSCNASGRGCDPVQIAAADGDGNFLYDPEEPSFDDPFVEVNAYHHANVVAAYFRDTHDFTWTCGSDALMRVFVNYTEGPGVAYDNAAYSPSSGSECGFMLFGQGARDFAYDSDVIYHEFGHAMVDGTASLDFFLLDELGLAYDPSAVNEGTADYFAATVSGDPLMAEYFMGGGSTGIGGTEGALRRLDNDLVCPDDLVGEGHFDGRIWAALGWDIREAIGADKADALVFATVGALDMVPSLSDAAETLVATADALLADGLLTPDDRVAVDAAVEGRGLLGCRRVAPLDDGEPRLAYSGQGELTASAGGSIAPVHYSIEIPADATSLLLRIERLTPDGTFRLYTREGAPVRFVATRRPPLIANGDWEPNFNGDVVIDLDTDPPLPRCETLYVAVVTEDLRTIGAALYSVSAQLERSGVETSCDADPDAGVPAGDAGGPDGGVGDVRPGGGGCSCRVGASSGAPAPIVMLALILGLLVRRR